MKHIVSIFVLFVVAANASYVKTKHYYDAGQYAKAAKEAKASYSEYENYRLHLLWAKSASKLGHTTEAMAAYERVLILNKKNQEAKRALEAIYAQTGRSELSADGAEKAGADASVIKGKADFSVGHDSNINIQSAGADLDAYYGVNGNKDGLSTTFLKFEGEASCLHTFSQQRRWYTKSALGILAQNNLDAHNYDLYAVSGEMGLGYNGERASFYIPVIANRVYYLERNFLNQYKVMPRVTFSGPFDVNVEIGADYVYKSHIAKEDENMDSEELAGSIGLYIPLENSTTYIGVGYHKRTANSSSPERFIPADFLTFDISSKYHFNDTFSAELYYKYKQGSYESDIGSGAIHSSITREDHFRQWGAKLTYAKSKKVKVYLRGEYTDNSSNYMPAEYDKNSVSVGVNLSF